MSQSETDYSWAAYLDSMEGGMSDIVTLPAAKPAARVEAKAKPDHPIWGVLLALGVTLLAFWLSTLAFWPFTLAAAGGKVTHPIEPVMIAIILGMVLSNSWAVPKLFQPGIKYSVKKVLPLGIVLLGARLNFGQMMKVGAQGLLLSAVETLLALIILAVLSRWLNLPRKLGLLLGVGTAICGGTAIVATAPVIEAEDKDVAFSVATVTLLGLIAMFTLPIIGHFLALTDKQFGIWAGLAIHQTPQVVAAGYAYSPVAGDMATIVKLARVCLLAPVVFAIGFLYARQKANAGREASAKKVSYFQMFPLFILGFIGMALLNTLGFLPNLTFNTADFVSKLPHTFGLAALSEEVSRFCIILSMAGVGLETKFAAMRQTGMRPFVASLVAVLIVAIVVLALISVMGI